MREEQGADAPMREEGAGDNSQAEAEADAESIVLEDGPPPSPEYEMTDAEGDREEVLSPMT